MRPSDLSDWAAFGPVDFVSPFIATRSRPGYAAAVTAWTRRTSSGLRLPVRCFSTTAAYCLAVSLALSAPRVFLATSKNFWRLSQQKIFGYSVMCDSSARLEVLPRYRFPMSSPSCSGCTAQRRPEAARSTRAPGPQRGAVERESTKTTRLLLGNLVVQFPCGDSVASCYHTGAAGERRGDGVPSASHFSECQSGAKTEITKRDGSVLFGHLVTQKGCIGAKKMPATPWAMLDCRGFAGNINTSRSYCHMEPERTLLRSLGVSKPRRNLPTQFPRVPRPFTRTRVLTRPSATAWAGSELLTSFRYR
jgi:hypothetical protein